MPGKAGSSESPGGKADSQAVGVSGVMDCSIDAFHYLSNSF